MLPILRRNPLFNWVDWDNPLDLMPRRLEHMFDNWPQGAATAAYPVDIREDDNNIYVDAELPGFAKDQIDLTVENGVLSINAERKLEETKGEKHLTERHYTRVSRAFKLPTAVDENKVNAELKDGVLHLTLQKREEVKPRRITVK